MIFIVQRGTNKQTSDQIWFNREVKDKTSYEDNKLRRFKINLHRDSFSNIK